MATVDKKTKRPLQVGERVRVFFCAGSGEIATIREVANDQCLELFCSDGSTIFANPRQCVRLKKKQKPQEPKRMEMKGETNGSAFYVSEAKYGQVYMVRLRGPIDKGPGRSFHLVELQPGEFITSKAKLAEAWDNAPNVEAYALKAEHSYMFKHICKELGVE